jgi:hypothetical protein
MVADNNSGKSVMSQVRTSSGTFLAKHEVTHLRPSSSSCAMPPVDSSAFDLVLVAECVRQNSQAHR